MEFFSYVNCDENLKIEEIRKKLFSSMEGEEKYFYCYFHTKKSERNNLPRRLM